MGLLYRKMILEIKEKFVKSGFSDLEEFLRFYERELQDEYRVGGVLFYLNINKLLEEENKESSYFKEKFEKENLEN